MEISLSLDPAVGIFNFIESELVELEKQLRQSIYAELNEIELTTADVPFK